MIRSGWCPCLEFFGRVWGVGSFLVSSGYEWSSRVFDCLSIRHGCGFMGGVWEGCLARGCVLTPLYVLGVVGEACFLGTFLVSLCFQVVFGCCLVLF